MDNANYIQYKKAKTLIKQRKISEAIVILKDILKHENDNYVKFELVKCLTKSNATKGEARKYLKQLLCTQDKNFATFELGRLEASTGNVEAAKYYFEQLLKSKDTKNKKYAMLELGKLELSIGNIDVAKNYFEQLLRINGKNTLYVMLELGKLEMITGNFNKARNYFEQLLYTENKNYAILELGKLEASLGNIDKARYYFKRLSNDHATNELIFLELKNNNYQEAYQYLKKLLLVEKNNLLDNIEFYLKNKLGLLSEAEKKPKYYLMQQIINYQKEKAIEHINEHMKDSTIDDDVIESSFYNNIDINSLYEDAQVRIASKKPHKSSIVDKYILKYDQPMGTFYRKETNLIQVVTIVNTKDIITMYPTITGYEERIVKRLTKKI